MARVLNFPPSVVLQRLSTLPLARAWLASNQPMSYYELILLYYSSY